MVSSSVCDYNAYQGPSSRLQLSPGSGNAVSSSALQPRVVVIPTAPSPGASVFLVGSLSPASLL